MRDHEGEAGEILQKVDGGDHVVLTLNRPDRFNALSEDLLEALRRELDHVAGRPEILCVVLAANGKAFCAGHDLGEMHGRSDEASFQDLFDRCSTVMQAIRALPVPVVARVHGVATAAGCQLAASCDLAIASRSARFAVSGIDVGLFCSTPAVALSRSISAKRAFDLLVTARFIDADTAADWGLVNEVVDDDQLDATVARLVRTIASKSPAAIRHGKAMFYRQLGMMLPEAYAFASATMTRNMAEPDVAEGIGAFFDRRPPVWGA